MSKKVTDPKVFFDKLADFAKEELTDVRQVALAKKMYLIKSRENIQLAKEAGYTYPMIAKAATTELLETTDLPKTFIVKKKDAEEVTVETKFGAVEIKKFCEPEGNA